MGIHVMTGLGPSYLNAGMMKPQKGSTPIAGEERPGMGVGFLLTLLLKFSSLLSKMLFHRFKKDLRSFGAMLSTLSALSLVKF